MTGISFARAVPHAEAHEALDRGKQPALGRHQRVDVVAADARGVGHVLEHHLAVRAHRRHQHRIAREVIENALEVRMDNPPPGDGHGRS
ncbi:MAG: hypothetical protein FJ363_08840 [Gemmatimonadetes bacterium]|nr:hypothetical protein [Gemmatimonadota bacterium]